MFDISEPRKHSGTEELAKLSRERAVGGQAEPSGADSSLWSLQHRAWLSIFTLMPAPRAWAVEDAAESAHSSCSRLLS